MTDQPGGKGGSTGEAGPAAATPAPATEATRELEALVSEAQYRAIIRSAVDGFWAVDREGRFLDVNDTYLALIGYSRDEFLRLRVTDVEAAESPEEVAAHIREITARGSDRFETRHRHKDGHTIDVEVAAIYLGSGGGRFVVLIRDISDRKRAERERISFMLGIERANDAIITTGLDGVIKYVNPAFEALYGYGRAEVIGKTPRVLKSGTTDEGTYRRLWATLLGKESLRLEIVNKTKNGALLDIDLSANPILDSGEIIGFLAIHRNVTERRKAEEALRDSEERLRSLVDNMIDGVAYCQMLYEGDRPTDFVYLSVNAAFEKLTGLENVVGRRSSELFPGARASDPMAFEICARVAATGKAERFETRIAALDAWFDFSVYSSEKGRFVAVLNLLTNQKQVEAALGRARSNVRQVIDQLPDGVTVQRDGKVIHANPALCALVGVEDPSTLLGTGWLDLVAPEHRPWALERLQGLPAADGRAEVRLVRKDGQPVMVAFSAAQVIEFDGLPAHLSLVRDITDRIKTHAQLVLSDRMVSVGMLAAGIAHEINNPLAAVSMNLSQAAGLLAAVDRPGGSPEALAELREVLGDAREGAERVRHIVRDLKIFSRSEEDHIGRVDLHRLLDSTLRMAWNEVRHRARLVKDYGPIAAVRGNEGRLGQVFLNLVVNAAQAIPEGRANNNEIRVVTRTDAQGRVVVEVKDTGPGIAPDVKAHLFTPFFTTKPIGQGTGLGLSICHRIVSDLGGEIEVESEVGKGATFRVLLDPAPPDSADRLPAAPPNGAAAPRRGRILIIDDEVSIGRAMRRVLVKEHDVVATISAQEAMAMIRAGDRFDVILCDLMMPEMTGMEFHAELRRVAPELVERVIFMTGGAFTPAAREFLDEVPNVRLEKPLDAKNLQSLVRDRLQ